MRIDALVAEIGSTTTKVNAFHGLNTLKPKFIGQGQSPTTVLEGDVTEGLRSAIDDLKTSLGVGELVWNEFFAASSAAGGLRMSVHGLVYDMTVRAAKEAALGAGGIVNFVTAGKLKAADVEKLREIRPSMILVAGGVDYGERETPPQLQAVIRRVPKNAFHLCGQRTKPGRGQIARNKKRRQCLYHGKCVSRCGHAQRRPRACDHSKRFRRPYH
jgi:hypothetical protein